MLSGYKILIAEDDALNQKIATIILQRNGAEVFTVSNGREAIKQLQHNNFDVILMDLHMPEMDGIEATTYIRQVLHNYIPIIALSASNFDLDLKRCMEAGMNLCISKPFDINNLSQLIKNITLKNKLSAE